MQELDNLHFHCFEKNAVFSRVSVNKDQIFEIDKPVFLAAHALKYALIS